MRNFLKKDTPKKQSALNLPNQQGPKQPGQPEKIQGQIERITFQNEENGFTVAKMKVQGKKDLVTVTGNLPSTNAGEVLDLWGEWSNHPKFGHQFKIERFKSVMPATAAGIEKYLGSGLIKGIGPIMASRLVKKFGVETLEVIENEPEHHNAPVKPPLHWTNPGQEAGHSGRHEKGSCHRSQERQNPEEVYRARE